MADPILYQIDQLTLTDTHVIHGDLAVPYGSVGRTAIFERRPLVAVGCAGVLGFVLACSAQWWAAGLVGARLSLKLGLLLAVPFAAVALYGFTHKISCLHLWIDTRATMVLKRKDRYPLEVAQRVIETAKRTYGAVGAAGSRAETGDLRSDLNPL